MSRGDIFILDLGLAQKARPVAIVSVAYQDHERAVVTFVPRTTSLRGTRFEVPHQALHFAPGAFDVQGIASVPSVKLGRRLGSLDDRTLAAIDAAIRLWLHL